MPPPPSSRSGGRGGEEMPSWRRRRAQKSTGWDGIGVGLTVILDHICYFEVCTKLSTLNPFRAPPSLFPVHPASIAIISSWALDRRHPTLVAASQIAGDKSGGRKETNHLLCSRHPSIQRSLRMIRIWGINFARGIHEEVDPISGPPPPEGSFRRGATEMI